MSRTSARWASFFEASSMSMFFQQGDDRFLQTGDDLVKPVLAQFGQVLRLSWRTR